MPVTIIIGGQYGSEGKGKVAHYFAREMKASFAVRCGGPNSGHTVIDEQGRARIFQQLPTAAILPDVKLAICSGSYINLDILLREIVETNLDKGRLLIDANAVIITEELKARETQSGLMDRIGSTGSGTGAAVAARINREPSLLFAKNIPELKPFIANVSKKLRGSLNRRERIIIEGTQGFGLSPLHGGHYPYATSRDTTAAAFLSETGLSPLDVDDVIMTIRTFPIRVAGNSGLLVNEIDWQTINSEGDHESSIQERTSVTKCIRRVARFDDQIVKKAILVNMPSRLILNHMDYLSKDFSKNTELIDAFILNIEKKLNRPIDFVGYGPDSLTISNGTLL